MSSSVYRSATISLIDCNRLEPLADVCREIFTSCREGIAALEGAKSSQVQTYFRESDRQYLQWFYDLEDIIIKCGATSEQLKQLQYALEECVLYKKATEKLLGETPINHHCGLSMYLPFKERNYLNSHYKTLEWNKATGLVQ